jgi:hypothetical protein
MPNPQPVYIDINGKRYRIHHGAVGAGLTLIGVIGMALSEDRRAREVFAFMTGAGLKLMEDDIADMGDWLSFK